MGPTSHSSLTSRASTRTPRGHPAEGTHTRKVTASTLDDVLPSWAPDGSKLAFIRVNGPSQQVFTIKPDGSGLHKLTNNGLLKGQMAWSPDGTKIVLTAGSEGNPDLYVM